MDKIKKAQETMYPKKSSIHAHPHPHVSQRGDKSGTSCWQTFPEIIQLHTILHPPSLT